MPFGEFYRTALTGVAVLLMGGTLSGAAKADELDIETYSCSPHSNAVLAQAEVLKAYNQQMLSQMQQGHGGAQMGGQMTGHVAGQMGGQMAGGYGVMGHGSMAASFSPNAYGMAGGQQPMPFGPAEQALNQQLNQRIGAVMSGQADFDHIFGVHPALRERFELAKREGSPFGPGPVILDPREVARQFGLAETAGGTVAFGGGFGPALSFEVEPPPRSILGQVWYTVRSFIYWNL